MAKFDQIIRNCKVINGCGTPWFVSDVAINSDKIAAVGSLDNCSAKCEIDGKGCYLSPGFIDSHTHDDISILSDGNHSCKLLQGVTTIVTGNCSFSNYPKRHDTTHAIEHLSSLLGEIREEQMCEDFNSYKNLLNKNGISINVVSLVGHGPIRLYVMKGFDKRHATQHEINQMCSILEEQLRQGSAGLSLGLVYPPSAFAHFDELVSLAQMVHKYDRILTAHIRCYSGNLLKSIEEFILILRKSGAKGLLSHLQIAGTPYWGQMQKAIDMIEEARISGVDISIDMYPYTAGSSSILQLLPPFVNKGGIHDLIERFNDNEFYEYMRQMVESGSDQEWESKIKLIGWENVTIASVTAQQLKQFEGKSMTESASILSMNCFDFLIHMIRVDSGTTNIIMFQQSDEDQRTVHSSRLQMVGSDGIPRKGGKPHPRLFGTFPRVVGRLALKQRLIQLEEAIRRMTSLTAHRFQLYERGLIIPGLTADLVLFNDEFIDNADYENPQQNPNGLIAVWVNGKQVVNNKLLNNNIFSGVVINTNFAKD